MNAGMKKSYTIALGLFIAFSVNAQDTLNRSPFLAEASYTGDNAANLDGGIKTGYAYLGMVNLSLFFDFEKAGLWKGGSVFIHAANTHGAVPSAKMFGDAQVASNIEAGNHTYVQELYYKQTLGKVELTIGLQDLNVEFVNSGYGALFLNSSFGIMPVISANLAAPIFPLTSPGFTTRININERSTWLVALYDGCPTGVDDNPNNLKWQFNSGDGLLAITEYQRTLQINRHQGLYKIGLFSHNHVIQKAFGEALPDSLNRIIAGAYVLVDQVIWERNEKSLGIFTQAGYSPSGYSANDVYVGMGLNMGGFLSKKKNDVLGLAVAHAHYTGGTGSETSVELTWLKPVHKHITIQPDIQYIIQPSGKVGGLRNVFAGVLRIALSF